MTGSLSVKGEVLPVGGVSAKIEAAIDAGLKRVIIPKENLGDVVLSPEKLRKVKIETASTLADVLRLTLKESAQKKALLAKIGKISV